MAEFPPNIGSPATRAITRAGIVSLTDLAAFPVTLFVRADGTIMRQTGALTQAELEQYVQELLQ